MSFGEYLSAVISAVGISRDTLAKRVGISRRSLYRYTADIQRPTPAILDRLCEVLGLCPIDTAGRFVRVRSGRPSKKR